MVDGNDIAVPLRDGKHSGSGDYNGDAKCRGKRIGNGSKVNVSMNSAVTANVTTTATATVVNGLCAIPRPPKAFWTSGSTLKKPNQPTTMTAKKTRLLVALSQKKTHTHGTQTTNAQEINHRRTIKENVKYLLKTELKKNTKN